MKTLRIIRMIIAALFLAATVVFFLSTGSLHDSLEFTEESQLIPSAIAFSMGALLFWLCVTFFMGRLYCSTVCPIGTVSDVAMRFRRELGKLFPRFKKPFRYKAGKIWRFHIMVAYFLCLVLGIMVVPFIFEPWNIARNVAAIHSSDSVAFTWTTLGIGAGWGIGFGVALLLLVVVWGFINGRDYCNTICPIGQAMGVIDRFSLLHIEIDPDKCISCLKCEDICRSSCIKVSDRYVDNTRCVKCFDCIAICPNDAIRLQSNRNRAATPLMMKN